MDWSKNHEPNGYNLLELAGVLQFNLGDKPFCKQLSKFTSDKWTVCNNDESVIIPLTLVGYEMIIANSALHASLAIYRVISNVHSWNHC